MEFLHVKTDYFTLIQRLVQICYGDEDQYTVRSTRILTGSIFQGRAKYNVLDKYIQTGLSKI